MRLALAWPACTWCEGVVVEDIVGVVEEGAVEEGVVGCVGVVEEGVVEEGVVEDVVGQRVTWRMAEGMESIMRRGCNWIVARAPIHAWRTGSQDLTMDLARE